MGRTMNAKIRLTALRKCARGASAIEYALLISLIAVAGITAFKMTGTAVSGTMNNAAEVMPGEGLTIPDPNTP